jgi:hypothetical protein
MVWVWLIGRIKDVQMKLQYPLLACWIVLAGMVCGCADTSHEQTVEQRQDAALKDPFGYQPQVGRDIGGGDITTFDKSGFDKDMHDLLQP